MSNQLSSFMNTTKDLHFVRIAARVTLLLTSILYYSVFKITTDFCELVDR